MVDPHNVKQEVWEESWDPENWGSDVLPTGWIISDRFYNDVDLWEDLDFKN